MLKYVFQLYKVLQNYQFYRIDIEKIMLCHDEERIENRILLSLY